MAPSWAPFGHPKRHQNRTKNRSKIVLPEDGLQDRSKTAQEPPKTPPGLPRTPPGPPKTPQKRPQEPPGTPQEPPKMPLPRLQGPLAPSKKSKKFEFVKKKLKKKSTMFVQDCQSTKSLPKIESRSQRSNPRGWLHLPLPAATEHAATVSKEKKVPQVGGIGR